MSDTDPHDGKTDRMATLFGIRDIKRFNSERLYAAIERVEVEIDQRSQAPGSEWSEPAGRYLESAKEHQRHGEFDAGWTALKAAERETICGYDETELRMEADRLCQEAKDKLHGWRRRTVERVLCTKVDKYGGQGLKGDLQEVLDDFGTRDGTPGDLQELIARVQSVLAANRPMAIKDLQDLRLRVKKARLIVDDHLDNVHMKQRLLARHLFWGAIVLVLALAAVVIAVNRGIELERVDEVFKEWEDFVLVMFLGALGAALSGLLNLLAADNEARIPDVKAQRTLVWLRPFVGAAGAIVAVGTLIALDITGSTDPRFLYAIAFAAGFSERFVSRAVSAASTALLK